jgi:outer membrane protein assembly factor BamD
VGTIVITKKHLAVWLVFGALFSAGCRHKKYENPITKDTEQPDKVLFDKAVGDIERGRYEIARLTLNTLMNTYDTSEYLAKAKLAIADSWFREGGAHALAQAEAEYKDFILFYPTMEESAESQSKICDIHYKQIEKADRDDVHLIRADEECRQLLTQFPNSRFAPQVAQRLRGLQEVIGEREFRVGSYYVSRGAWAASANRFKGMTEQYPLFSKSDAALMMMGSSYSKMGPRFRQDAIAAYQKVVREYPLSGSVEEAKKRLKALEGEIPEPDPVAVARMKYEKENATKTGTFAKAWGTFSSKPDMNRAAKSGNPAMTTLRPLIPVSVPAPPAPAGVTDITVQADPSGAATSDLEKKPDARQNPDGTAATTDSTKSTTDTPAPDSKQTKKKKKAKKQQ